MRTFREYTIRAVERGPILPPAADIISVAVRSMTSRAQDSNNALFLDRNLVR